MEYLGKILFVTIVFFSAADFAGSHAASSTNYILEKDSINFGGGLSTSTDYALESTMGEPGSGVSTSSAYVMSAGYQAMDIDAFIALTVPADVTLDAEISGQTGGSAEGTAAWGVQTDNSAGYELSVRAASAPALAAGANSFADYVPSYSDPDYSFTVLTGESKFGFSPEGANLVARYRDNGVACGTGALDTEAKCWDGFTLTPQVIAQSAAANSPDWATTTLRFRAEAGASKAQAIGSYSASIIMSAVTL